MCESFLFDILASYFLKKHMETSTDSSTLREKASTLSDRIDLQGSDVDKAFFQEKCARCPANDGIFYNIDTSRHKLYCALQASLLLGQVDEAARMTDHVEDKLGKDPGCPPHYGGKNMREFSMALEETEAY